MARRARLVICILAMTATITVMFGFGRNILVVMWPDVKARYDLDYAQVAYLVAMHQAAYLLSSIAAGYAALRVSARLLITGSTLAGGVLIAVIAFAGTFWHLLAIYTTLGALIATAWVPMIRFASQTLTPPERIAALGTAACGTAVGFLINGFVVTPVLQTQGFAALWVGAGSVTLLVGAATLAALSGLSRLPQADSVSGLGRQTATPGSKTSFPVGVFCTILFLCGFGLVSFQTYFAAYLVEDLNVSNLMAGRYWVFAGLLGAFSGVFLSYVANRSSLKLTIVLSLVALASCIALMGVLASAEVAVIAAAVYGLLYFGLFGLFPAFLANVLDETHASSIFGKANLFLGLGSVAGGIAGGKVAHHFDGFTVLWILSAVAVAVAAFLMWRIPDGRTSHVAALKTR